MRISKVSFSRIVNLGNFENEKMETVVELEPSDDPVKAIAEAMYTTKRALKLRTSRKECYSAVLESFEDGFPVRPTIPYETHSGQERKEEVEIQEEEVKDPHMEDFRINPGSSQKKEINLSQEDFQSSV